MTPEQMTALAARLKLEARRQSVQSSAAAFQLANDLDAAADLIEQMAQAEPVAWMWQHDETGRTGFVDQWQINNGWAEQNPRCKIVGPLYLAPPVVLPPHDKRAEPWLHEYAEKYA